MFAETFTESEGPEAGQLIKELVADMLASPSGEGMYVFSAVKGEKILGSIVFTRMVYEQDDRKVFILAPVAISSDQQGKGLGQRLIYHGLDVLKKRGVDIYSKVGFAHISEADVQAPLTIQYPEGWLGQSLSAETFEPLKGSSKCVAPLNNPDHW